MATTTSYTHARANLAAVLDEVVNDREVVVIKRRGHEDVALIAADDLDGLVETLYLLSTRANADRLLGALEDARAGRGIPVTIEQLRREVGLD
jgi:antitoxin YefM